MGLISNKPTDSVITGTERLLATDSDGTTVNVQVNTLAAFISSYIGSITSGGQLSFTYDSSVAAGATSGTFRLNNVDATLATKLYISTEDNSAVDTIDILENMNSGSEVIIRQGAEFELYQITAGVDQTTYFELTVTHLDSSSGSLTTGDATQFTFFGVGGVVTDNSLSEANQIIADGTTRIVRTTNAGYISFQQDSTELMRLGGNNDQAIYIKTVEATPGQSAVSFISPLKVAQLDTTALAANSFTNAIVQDSTDDYLYYSNGSSWYEITTDKSLSAQDQSILASVDRVVNASTATSTFKLQAQATDVLKVDGNVNDRIYVDGLESVAGNNTIVFYDAPELPEVNTGAVAASGYSGALVQDTGTVYYSDGTSWNGLSPQPTSSLIVKDAASPGTISNYYYGTQAQIDAISPKDANTIYIPSDGISPATPVSTASSTALSLETTGGHYYNMASANTATTYTITGTSVLGGWAKVRINAASEPTVTGATKSGGVTFATSTDMYLYVEYNGSRAEYWFAEY